MKSTLDFIANPANKSPKRGALRLLTSVETPDVSTVVIRLSEPYASFTVNLIATAIGIVPANAGADFSRHPIGTGLPYLPLWFNDVVSVRRRSLGALDLPSTGNYNFLSTLQANRK